MSYSESDSQELIAENTSVRVTSGQAASEHVMSIGNSDLAELTLNFIHRKCVYIDYIYIILFFQIGQTVFSLLETASVETSLLRTQGWKPGLSPSFHFSVCFFHLFFY